MLWDGRKMLKIATQLSIKTLVPGFLRQIGWDVYSFLLTFPI